MYIINRPSPPNQIHKILKSSSYLEQGNTWNLYLANGAWSQNIKESIPELELFLVMTSDVTRENGGGGGCRFGLVWPTSEGVHVAYSYTPLPTVALNTRVRYSYTVWLIACIPALTCQSRLTARRIKQLYSMYSRKRILILLLVPMYQITNLHFLLFQTIEVQISLWNDKLVWHSAKLNL